MELLSINLTFPKINVYAEVDNGDEQAFLGYEVLYSNNTIAVELGDFYKPGHCSGDQLLYMIRNVEKLRYKGRPCSGLNIQPGTEADTDTPDPEALDVWLFF